MRRLIFPLFFLLGLALSMFAGKPAQAEEGAVSLHLFWSQTCPHCAKEKALLGELAKGDPSLKVYSYELTESRENRELFAKVGKALGADISYVPFTVIGEDYFTGFVDEESTGALVKELVVKARVAGCRDVVGEITGTAKPEEPKTASDSACEESGEEGKSIPKELKLSVFGKVKIADLSLPALTLVLALSDGFNPCAMWVLLFLISLLLGMKDLTKMWILGITFILTSGVVYFLFMTVWLNLFLFIGYQTWARVVIGLVALSGAFYMLRDFFRNKDGGCQITGEKKRQKVFEKLKAVALNPRFGVAVLGIAGLAFAVNLVEFFCSFGLPAVYTQTLSLAGLPGWQYYLYLAVYVFIFMLDDLVVFGAAMVTMRAVGVEGRYARLAHLVGGLVLALVGLAMLLRPEILMRG